MDIDLVLPGCRFALAELHGNARRGHVVAKLAVERFRLRGLQEVVVLVIPTEELQVVKVLGGRALVRVLEEIELQLARHHHVIAELTSALHLATENTARRYGDELARL